MKAYMHLTADEQIGIIGARGLHQQRVHLGLRLRSAARLRLGIIPSPHLVIVFHDCVPFLSPVQKTRLLGVHMEDHNRAATSQFHDDLDARHQRVPVTRPVNFTKVSPSST